MVPFSFNKWSPFRLTKAAQLAIILNYFGVRFESPCKAFLRDIRLRMMCCAEITWDYILRRIPGIPLALDLDTSFPSLGGE